jgi:hypothetical protein
MALVVQLAIVQRILDILLEATVWPPPTNHDPPVTVVAVFIQ